MRPVIALHEMFGRGRAKRQALFRRYVDLRRQAASSEDEADHAEAAKAYRAYHRSFLPATQRALFEAQEEIAELRAELARRDREGRAS